LPAPAIKDCYSQLSAHTRLYNGAMSERYVAPGLAAIERYWQALPKSAWDTVCELQPHAQGPFLRPSRGTDKPLVVVGQWGLIPWFAKERELKYGTHTARVEELRSKAAFKQAWASAQRCIVPAASFDEPCWYTGDPVWWRFRRKDGEPWGLAGLWAAWTDKRSGEQCESYALLTVSAGAHPLLSRMQKPDPALPPGAQDKRSVIAIEPDEVARWLNGTMEEATALMKPPPLTVLHGEALAA
jgi:putative SOS response-associated peptidase YedK